MSLRFFAWCLYAFVGAFFAVAAVVKLLDPEAFLSSMLTYQVFPHKVAVALAYFAPVLELVVALCLVTGFWRKGASLLTVGMLVLFVGLVGQGLVRGLEMNCGCFGANHLQSTSDYLLKIGQNVLLLLAVLLARFLEYKK